MTQIAILRGSATRRAAVRSAYKILPVAPPLVPQFDEEAAGIDGEVHALWEDRQSLTRQRRQDYVAILDLQEALPWWAAPGPQYLASDGTMIGDRVWYPAILGLEPPAFGKRNIRPGEFEIKRWFQAANALNGEVSDRLQEALEAFHERCKARKAEERKVGLHSLKHRRDRTNMAFYRNRDRINELAAAGTSMVALAAAALMAFAGTTHDDSTMRDQGSVSRGLLVAARPSLRGLLAKHADLVLRHPGRHVGNLPFRRRHWPQF